MKNFKIIFYEAITGECPIEEFQDSLDKKMRVKLIGMLEIPEEKGNMLREPDSKSLGEGIFKLRCKLICSQENKKYVNGQKGQNVVSFAKLFFSFKEKRKEEKCL